MRSPVARGIVWGLAVLICVVGIWMSMHLALLHFRTTTKQDDGLLSRACTGFATSSCQKVAQSRWAWFPPRPDPKAAQTEAAPKPAAGEPAPAEADLEPGAGAATAQKQSGGPRVPTAQLGLIYFSCVLCWLVFTGPYRATRTWPHMVFVAGTLAGVPASAFFEYVMWTQLDAWCPLCLATHAGSVILPVLALLLWPRATQGGAVVVTPSATVIAEPQGGGLFSPVPAASRSDWSGSAAQPWPSNLAIFGAVFSAALLVGLTHFFIVNRSSIYQGAADKFQKEYYEKKWMAYERHWEHNYMAWSKQPVLDIPIDDRPVRGPADAPNTIVVFSDFECPSCAKFEDYLLKSVLPRKAGGKPAFKLVFKHWPICKDCNDTIQGASIHPAACEAALATEAARMLGGDEAFWKMHDLLFARQNEWRKSRDFMPYARELGFDEAEFRKAMDSSEAMARVRADVADGANLGSAIENPAQRAEAKVDSTPTIFVNGKRLNSPQWAKTWGAIIQTPPANRAQATRPAAAVPATAPARVGPVVQ